MTGRIARVNLQRGMLAVATEGHDYTIFELLSSDPIAVGDEVSWSPDLQLGRGMLTNLTKHACLQVFFQNHGVSAAQLAQLLLLAPTNRA